MKKFLYGILLALFVLFPGSVFALGDITVSPGSLTVEQGSSVKFTISAYNTIGDVSISSGNNNVATIDVNQWSTGIVEEKQTKTGTITVVGKSVGTTEIILNIDGATFDEEEISSTKKITVNVVAAKSSNTNLSSIKIDGEGVKNFNSSNTTYTVANTNASSINISAVVEDSKSSVSGLGNKNLSYGLNVFDLVVTAENGSKKTYTVKINRNDNRSSDNTLASLTVSKGKIDFDKNRLNYNIIVDNNVDEIKVSAKANDSKAKVVGAGAYALKVYGNTIYIEVIAENGSKKTYVLKVVRKDENGNVGELSSVNTLESLVVSGYDIEFNKDKDVYYLDVAKNVDKVEVIAKSTDEKATVTINNPEKLALGDNTIIIDVTAENGTTKTYKIIVNRDNEIPKITLSELLDVLDSDDTDTIIVNIKDDNNTLTREMLEKLKSSKKRLIINKYINDEIRYTWEIDGSGIKDVKDINTLIEFNDFDKKIDDLTDYARYLYFKNNLDTSVFKKIILKIYTDGYSDNNIYGYIYDSEELELKYDNLKYIDTYIEIDNIDSGSYVITQKEVNNNCIYKVIAIVEFIAILLFIISIVVFNIIVKKKDINKKKK